MQTSMQEEFKAIMTIASDPNILNKEPKFKEIDQFNYWHEQLKSCQLFEVNASLKEISMDEIPDTFPYLSNQKDFYLPYDKIACYINGDIRLPLRNDTQEYEQQKVIGFAVHRWKALPPHVKMLEIFDSEKKYPQGEWYDCYIYSYGKVREDGTEGINTQDCMFIFQKTELGSFVYINEHLGMCSDKEHCKLNVFGKFTDTDHTVCQEVVSRRMFTYLIIDLVNQLNQPRPVVHREVNIPRKEKVTPKQDHRNVPKELLVSLKDIVIDRPRIVYDKIVEHGKGGEHKIKYVVKRHIRITNNKIIWVSAHTRGKGEFVARWHIKSQEVSLPRFQILLEKATQHRMIEPMLIRIIRYLRGRK